MLVWRYRERPCLFMKSPKSMMRDDLNGTEGVQARQDTCEHFGRALLNGCHRHIGSCTELWLHRRG
jgi:hypothetical protein